MRGPYRSLRPPHPDPLPPSRVHSESGADGGGEGADSTDYTQWAKASWRDGVRVAERHRRRSPSNAKPAVALASHRRFGCQTGLRPLWWETTVREGREFREVRLYLVAQALFVPPGTSDNSPPLQRWVPRISHVHSPGRGDRHALDGLTFPQISPASVVPGGTGRFVGIALPPLNRWAIVGCPWRDKTRRLFREYSP